MSDFLNIWNKLETHYKEISCLHLREVFLSDTERFKRMHETLHGLLFDYSKNRVTDETLDLLCRLAQAAGLPQQMEAMRSGEKINSSEQRAVLHIALRMPKNGQILFEGKNIVPDVHRELERALLLAQRLLDGSHHTAAGMRVTDFVHIGIGGSDLGPRLAVQALTPYHQHIRVHFVSNSDAAALYQTLNGLNPQSTVFCVASKSFTTPETLMNAQAAKKWLQQAGLSDGINRHFFAVSNHIAAAKAFGIDEENIFALPDWVGGRYSLWSAIGLPVMVAVGASKFRELLHGAHTMDEHFFHTPLRHNIPVLMALLHIWYNNFFHADGHTVAPYSHNLRFFPNWLTQLDMESCGKSRTHHGQAVHIKTGGIVFGGEGTDCQHAFFQLLHQGTRLIPCDFIVPVCSSFSDKQSQRFTAANAFAQAEALMRGKTASEVCDELAFMPETDRKRLAPQKEFLGNRPSNSLLLDELNPFNLGMLLAAYEHRTFVCGTIWDINPFDQWGVEYGKILAKTIEAELDNNASLKHDCSTNALIAFYRRFNTEN